MSRLPVDEGPERFLADYAERMRPLRLQHGAAYWTFSTTGDSQAQAQVTELEEQLSDLHADTRVFDAITGWLEGGVEDPSVDRQLRILRPDYRQAQVDEQLRKEIIRLALKIEETCSIYRAEFQGRRVSSNELDRALLNEQGDGVRRAAWEATREVGQRVAARVRVLVGMRNEQARALGFSDYFGLALDDEEMDASVLAGVLDDLQARTDEPWRRCKARLDAEFGALRGKAPEDLMPWDYTDRFLQSVPRPVDGRKLDPWFRSQSIGRYAQSFYRGIGLPIEGIWARSDMMPRDGKYPHAFCIGIDNPDDVRVLCNLDSTARWMETTLHEFGHAVYNAGISRELPWLLREAAHTFVTEAVAMYFGRLARNKNWLAQVARVPDELAEQAESARAEAQLVFVRWALVVTRFEQAMYQDPDQDLDTLWWDQIEQLQGLRRPAGWAGSDWAAKVHIACYPAYYQNYLLGELLASQFGAVVGPGVVGNREVGAFFSRLFALGQSLPWEQTVEQACGAPLSAEHWVAEFA